jgi:hypothetical protein
MKTLKFALEIGVIAGYGHDNANADEIRIEDIGRYWQEAAADAVGEHGIYVSAVITGPNRTVYHTDWGCPVGGELTFTITGSANPNFVDDVEDWKAAVLCVANMLKKRLQQSTVTVEFSEVQVEYLESPPRRRRPPIAKSAE